MSRDDGRSRGAAAEAAAGVAGHGGPVGLIGLGIMGGIMARSLRAAGLEVLGHDPLGRARQAARRLGVKLPGSNAEVARQAAVIFVSLPSAQALHEVVEELASVPPPTLQAGRSALRSIVVETSTLPLADKRRAATALRRQGRVLLDAPISGTATPTPERTWVMYLSGPQAHCRTAAALARHFTLKAPRVGALGSGMKLKIAANHLVAMTNVAVAEMTGLCRAMGLDPSIALEHMAGSPYIGTGLMALRMPMMIRREYEPATMKLALWQKDMDIIGAMARDSGASTPLLDECARLYAQALAQGRGQQDTAAVAEMLLR